MPTHEAVDQVLGPLTGTGTGGGALLPAVAAVQAGGALLGEVIDIPVSGAAGLAEVAGLSGQGTVMGAAAGGVSLVGERGRPGLPNDNEGWSGGNGITMHRTIVQQLDLRSGLVTFVVIPGKPKLMGRDVQTAKRVFRTVRKLDQKLPKKTVRETDSAKVKKAINAKIISSITCDPKPPC